MYLHPESVSDRLIRFMTESDKVLGYFLRFGRPKRQIDG